MSVAAVFVGTALVARFAPGAQVGRFGGSLRDDEGPRRGLIRTFGMADWRYRGTGDRVTLSPCAECRPLPP